MANNKKNLPNTGERMIPEFHENNLIYGEHLARYESVIKIIKNKKVLDIASGSGYGSNLMAKSAKSVEGVDVSEDAVNYSTVKYNRKNLNFSVGNASAIPFKANIFDVVVSFETLEHIDEDQNKFLEEIKRVMKKGGKLVISTPNDKVVPPGNHYHVHELSLAEFSALLKKHFKYVKIYYQAVSLASYIFDEKTFTSDGDVEISTSRKYNINPSDATYFVAVCSDTDKELKFDPKVALSENWRHIDEKNKFEYKQKIEKDLVAMAKENEMIKAELATIKKSKVLWLSKRLYKKLKYND